MKIALKFFAVGSAFLGGALALSACGDDVTKVYRTTEENSGMEIAKSVDDFDDCDSASIGKMMFASDENAAYICADSGWTPLSEKASDGKDGASCTVETLKDSTGYKIICGEDSVGVVLNGKAGAKGAKGEDGDAGAAGENGMSCAVEMLADSTSKEPKRAYSGLSGFFSIHPPLAYLKKSVPGATLGSISLKSMPGTFSPLGWQAAASIITGIINTNNFFIIYI